MADVDMLYELIDSLRERTIKEVELHENRRGFITAITLVFTTGEEARLTAGNHFIDWTLIPAKVNNPVIQVFEDDNTEQ